MTNSGSAWDLIPVVQFEFLPDVPFYTLKAYWLSVGSFPEVTEIEISIREATTDSRLAIGLTNPSSLVLAAIGIAVKKVLSMADIPRTEQNISAAEGMMIHVGLPIVERLRDKFATVADYMDDAFDIGDIKAIINRRSYRPYRFQGDWAVGIGEGRRVDVYCRDMNDKRRVTEAARDLEWPTTLTTQICFLGAIALGTEIYHPNIVESATDELRNICRFLSGEYDSKEDQK